MANPWEAEHIVDEQLAQSLIALQFPEVKPTRVTLLGQGWDNTVFRVNDSLVFRFPRREIAVAWLEHEVQVLQLIHDQLTLPIPKPLFLGQACNQFHWPFAGYNYLEGHTACGAELTTVQRKQNLSILASFLKTLHHIDVEKFSHIIPPKELLDRLNTDEFVPIVEKRLNQCFELELLKPHPVFQKVIDDACQAQANSQRCITHGDLYARHLLLNDSGVVSGVIDWGDTGLKQPAIDLSIVHSFFPKSMHDEFRHAYGDVDDGTWVMARFAAFYISVTIVLYGHDINDKALISSGKQGLAFISG